MAWSLASVMVVLSVVSVIWLAFRSLRARVGRANELGTAAPIHSVLGSERLQRIRAPTYPTTATIAGIAWIVLGALILFLNLPLVLLLLTWEAPPQPPGQGGALRPEATLGVCVGYFALVGAVFIYFGVQSVRGTAPGTLSRSIGSITFGLLNIGLGLLYLAAGALAPQAAARLIYSGAVFLAGAGLVATGVLAMLGRKDYKAWRHAQDGQIGLSDRAGSD